MKIYRERPSDERSVSEMKCYDLLERCEIPFERVDHEPAYTIEDCQEISETLQIEICKNLFLCNRQKTQFYLVMMPGGKKFDTKTFSKILGVSRLSFAPEERLPELLGLYPGSVSILGLMNDTKSLVRLVIDRPVIEQEFIGCHPCANTSSLKIPTKDVLEKILPAIHHEPTVVEL